MRILLVEDSLALQQSISEGLRRSGFAVDGVSDGKHGLLYSQTGDYDLIILDLMLPLLDGLTVLQRLRSRGNRTPVLLLTAKDTVADKVRGLDQGADDYLIKPFDFDELLARTKSLIRRSNGMVSNTLSLGDFQIDGSKRVALFCGKLLHFTPREFALVEYLFHRVGKPVARQELEEHLYDQYSQVNSNAIDVMVYGIRLKLEGMGAPQLIKTRRGFGYVIEEQP